MIRWNLDLLTMTREVLARNFIRAGVYFVSQERQFLNRDQPYRRAASGRHHGLNPSRPGEFPRKLTGQLQRSITWRLDKNSMVLTVGSNLKGYPSFLQKGTQFMSPRPFLTLGFDRVRDAMGKIILGK